MEANGLASERVLAAIEERIGHVEPSATFDELGLDSLDLLDLLQRVESESGRKFSDEEISAMNCVGDIVNACAHSS